MTTLEQLPPIGTTTQGQAPLLISVRTSPEKRPVFVGFTYTVPLRDDREGDPRARLSALVELARKAEAAHPYYADSPEQAQEQTALTAALREAQLRAIASREDREQLEG